MQGLSLPPDQKLETAKWVCLKIGEVPTKVANPFGFPLRPTFQLRNPGKPENMQPCGLGIPSEAEVRAEALAELCGLLPGQTAEVHVRPHLAGSPRRGGGGWEGVPCPGLNGQDPI